MWRRRKCAGASRRCARNCRPEASPPVVAKLDINAQPILYLGWRSRSPTLQQLRRLADNTIRPRLQRVPGVATVQVIGGEQREIHVDVDNAHLMPLGLTIEDVVNALKASGRDIPGGAVTQGSRETDVRLAGAFNSLDAIRSTQILAADPRTGISSALPSHAPQPSLPSPTPPLTVADVATVTDAQAERTAINRINGQRGRQPRPDQSRRRQHGHGRGRREPGAGATGADPAGRLQARWFCATTRRPSAKRSTM